MTNLRIAPNGAKPVDTFSGRQISLTLTGEQWFALLAKIANVALSAQGNAAAISASYSLGQQLATADNGSYGARKAQERMVHDVVLSDVPDYGREF